MTNPQIPSYSGVTINISNPTVNAVPSPLMAQQQSNTDVSNSLSAKEVIPTYAMQSVVTNPIAGSLSTLAQSDTQNGLESIPQAYPPQYYLNNYNYVQDGKSVSKTITEPELAKISSSEVNATSAELPVQTSDENPAQSQQKVVADKTNVKEEPDMTSSAAIINELDAKNAMQKELEQNGKKTKVVALTNEYIMSLENYLNNPNTEIRLMASKEILTRLDEDKDRFDDAALNALLNKMLQDPEKIIRIAALSAFSSQLASGNDYTVKLLTDIQKNPKSDQEDVVEAANILLKMSTSTETKYTPQQIVSPQIAE
jgi:hypothetical protein